MINETEKQQKQPHAIQWRKDKQQNAQPTSQASASLQISAQNDHRFKYIQSQKLLEDNLDYV